MAVNVITGSFNLVTSAAGNTQTVAHGLGVTPSLILFWCSGGAFTGTTDNTTGTSLNYMFGAVDGDLTQFGVSLRSNDNAATGTHAHGQRADAVIYQHGATGAITQQFNVQSLDDTNFVLDIDVASSVTMRVHFMAFGGDVNAAIVQTNEPGATGDLDITSSGFGTPTAALFFSVFDTSIPLAGNANDGRFSVGFYDGTTNGVVLVCANSGADPTETSRYGTGAHCVAMVDVTAATIDGSAAGTGFITDGVRINWDARASTRLVHAILLSGCVAKVFEGLTRTDGNDIAVTGAGGTPKGGLVISHNTAESAASTLDASASLSIGAWDSATSRRAASYWDEDAVATTEVAAGIEHDAVYLRISAADAVEGLMDVKSVDADGVTFVMDDTDPDAAWFGGIIFSEAAAGGGGGGGGAYYQHYYRTLTAR